MDSIKSIKIIPRKEIDKAFKNLLEKMLEDNETFGIFQDVDWLNNMVVKGRIKIELEITDLKHLI